MIAYLAWKVFIMGNDLISELTTLSSSRGSLDYDRLFNLFENETSGMYYYKKFKCLRNNLTSAKEMTDRIVELLKGFQQYNPGELINLSVKQEIQCKTFLDKLVQLNDKDFSELSCADYIKELEPVEPTDVCIKNTSIPWRYYCATTNYLLTKWNKTKRVFNVSLDWVTYLLCSMVESDDFPLDVLEQLPYNTFSFQITYPEIVLRVIIDYDREAKKIYIGGWAPNKFDSKVDDEMYEITFYSEIDVSGTFKDAVENGVFYLLQDVPSYTLLVSPRNSFWNVIDIGTHTNYGIPDNIKSYMTGCCGRYDKPPRIPIFINTESEKKYISETIWQILPQTVIVFLLYLASENTKSSIEQKDIPTTSHARSRRNKHKINNDEVIKEYTVAEREVALLRNANAFEPTSSGNPTGRTVKPHIRRAHWHRYWIGKRDSEERKLVLRFLMPTMVGGKESIDICNTNLFD